jgi:CheY-like chemotaxis protein
MTSFWDKKTPCWKLVDCPEENRRGCGAYLAQHYPCWELPLDKRCPIGERVGSCEECPVFLTYIKEYQTEEQIKSESRSVKVLVVDDELLIRWSLYQTLRRAGFEVTLAADGTEAIEKIRQESFDYALVDMRLPDEDGFTVIDEIQRLSPDSRVIIMTAYGSEETEDKTRERGVGYLPKPLDMEHITELLQ